MPTIIAITEWVAAFLLADAIASVAHSILAKRKAGDRPPKPREKAKARHGHGKTRSIVLGFYPTDMDVRESVKSRDDATAYIKRLVRDDMNK